MCYFFLLIFSCYFLSVYQLEQSDAGFPQDESPLIKSPIWGLHEEQPSEGDLLRPARAIVTEPADNGMSTS